MPRPLPDWIPPVTRSRMVTLKMSLKQLAEASDIPLTSQIDMLHNNENEYISRVVNMLKALGYPCSSPEFDILKELAGQKVLRNSSTSRTISSPAEVSKFYVSQTYGLTNLEPAA